jgi:hypothetical protein
MVEQQIRNLESWVPYFAEPVAMLHGEFEKQQRPCAAMLEYFWNELPGPGLSLAHLMLRIEAAKGIKNPVRLRAQANYDCAMNELTKALAAPDDVSRSERIGNTKEAAVAALFEYAAL